MKLYFLFIFLIVILSSCSTSVPDKPYYEEQNGLLSLEAENYSFNNGWSERSYYTGVGVNLNSQVNSDKRYIEYQFFINHPGQYNYYSLGSNTSFKDTDDNAYEIQIFNKDSLLQSVKAGFPNTKAPLWYSRDLNNNPVQIDFPESSIYKLRISEWSGDKYYLDKFIFSSNPAFKPKGIGPAETINPAPQENYRDSIVLPPQWAFGVMYGAYTNQEQSLQAIDSIIGGGFPIDAYSLDSYFWDFNNGAGPKGYINFVGDTTAYPDIKQLWQYMEQKNIKAGLWIWDLIQETGNEEVFSDFDSKDYFEDKYTNKNGWHNSDKNTLTGNVDFTNPEAAEYWKLKLSPFFEKGLDFLKLDNSSGIPFCKAAFDATREYGKETKGRGFILAHLHSTYDYRHKLYPTKWSGDAKIAWTQPDYPDNSIYAMGGLKENIQMVSDPKRSTYEIPFLAHDAGGYDFFGEPVVSEELYMRWAQFASMNSIMMIFSTAKNPTRNHPYRFSEKVQENFRKYSHLRLQLFPYIYSYAINTRLTGNKMMQGDGLHEEQFLLGNELLVAPVFKEGQTSRKVYFPEGEWIDWENNKRYSGEGYHTIEAPMDKLPLFVKSGSIIPMREYARSVEMGTNDSLILKIYPSETKTGFILYEDDGISNEYLKGIMSSSRFSMESNSTDVIFTIHKTEGEYKGMNNNRFYQLIFSSDAQPREIKINDSIINSQTGLSQHSPHWEYRKDSKTLNIMLFAEKNISTEIKINY